MATLIIFFGIAAFFLTCATAVYVWLALAAQHAPVLDELEQRAD